MSSAPDYSATIAAMAAYIEQQMTSSQVVGLAIVLVDDQRTVWAQGFGYADLEIRRPVTADTIFEIGSTSKTFTGTMVMQLYERGLLDIDGPLTTYLPRFSLRQPLGSISSASGIITPRTMMNHHSGIPADLGNGQSATVRYSDFNSRLVTFLSGDYADYPVNFVWSYSNTAVSLLTDVIAAASGQSFEQYSNELFATLGMDHSTFYPDNAVMAANRSKGYFLNDEYAPFYFNAPGAGSIVSSASEMAKYLKMVLAGGAGENGTVVRRETLELMLTPTNTSMPLDLDFRIGLSWILSDAELAYAGRLCWHNGRTPLFNSHMEVLCDQKLAVMVMTNSLTGEAAAGDIAKQALKLALREKSGISPPTPPGPAFSPVIVWTPAQLDAVAGIYVTSNGYDVPTRNASGLSWTADAQSAPAPAPVTLVPRANGWLSASDFQQSQYEFTTISGRDIMVKHAADDARTLRGERYNAQAIPAAWSARVGHYDIANLDPNDVMHYLPPEIASMVTSIDLKVQDGLMLLLSGEDAFVIAPLSDTLGYLRGLARKQGGTVQMANVDGEEQIQFLDYRYRKAA